MTFEFHSIHPDDKIDATIGRLQHDAPHAIPIIDRARERHDELQGAHLAMIQRSQELRDELGFAISETRRNPDDPAAERKVARIREQVRKHEESKKRRNDHDIYPRLESWLKAQAGRFRYKPRLIAAPASVAKAEKALASLESSRLDLIAKKKTLENEALTLEEAEAGLVKAIDALAAQGAPNLSPLFRVVRPVAAAISRRQFEHARQGTLVWPSHTVKGADLEAREFNALPILVNLFKDEILEKLRSRLAELQSFDPVSFQDRVAKIAEIDSQLRDLEYEEAANIAFLQENSKLRIGYRNDISVPAILGIEVAGQRRAGAWEAGGPEETDDE